MPSYTNEFGGQNVNPTMLSYIGYEIDSDLILVWPFEATQGADVAAAKMDIAAAAGGLKVFIPPANQVSVGQDVLVKNVGSYSFQVVDNLGNALGTVASGEAWFYYLTDNTTPAGTWDSVEFGAGTSSANAAALAGAGLIANVTKLDQNLITDRETANLAITALDRARVIQNEGGTVVWTFASVATLVNGFFFYAINAGTGTVTLTPTATTIDGEATKLLQPNENCIVFSDGVAFHTLGYGRVLISEVTGDSISVSGSGTLVLSTAELDAQVQDFTGTLTGARVIEYGNVVGYWFVYNNTSGAFTLTARVDSLDAGAVIPQGTFSIIRSNGTNMDVAFTDLGGTVTSVAGVAGQIVTSPNPITTTGTVGLADTAVTPGAYGSASETLTATVDQKGRLVAMGETAIQIALSQVNTFSSADLMGRLTDETGTGLAVFNNNPTLANPNVGTQAPGTNNDLASSTAFVTAAVAAAITSFLATYGIFRTGDIKYTDNTTLESGWIWRDGKTIGSAASGATNRANADTAALFTFYWDKYNDTLCPVSGGRGVSAAADFAANKTLQIPDARGRVLAAPDDQGGTAAGRLGSGLTGGITGAATAGATGGEQNADYDYAGTTGSNSTVQAVASGGTSAAFNGHTHDYSGTTDPGNNVQPTGVVGGVWVKL